MSVTLGESKGQTVLPLPAAEDITSEEVVLHDKDKVHLLESAVVTWTYQIKEMLKKGSDAAAQVCFCLAQVQRQSIAAAVGLAKDII